MIIGSNRKSANYTFHFVSNQHNVALQLELSTEVDIVLPKGSCHPQLNQQVASELRTDHNSRLPWWVCSDYLLQNMQIASNSQRKMLGLVV